MSDPFSGAPDLLDDYSPPTAAVLNDGLHAAALCLKSSGARPSSLLWLAASIMAGYALASGSPLEAVVMTVAEMATRVVARRKSAGKSV